MIVDDAMVELIPTAGRGPWSKVIWAIVRGLVGGGCWFLLSGT